MAATADVSPSGRIPRRMSRPSDRRRAAVIVIDACGAGALPDAAAYGDPADANTIAHVAEDAGGLHLPTFERLGLGSIVPVQGVPPAADPALHGRLHPLGPGKDSTTGHWELMGVVVDAPLPTYPDGFPADLVADLEQATGMRFCGNRPTDGTRDPRRLGAHHLRDRRGDPLHVGRLRAAARGARRRACPSPSCYAACEAAREVMRGEHAVGRVIARPFDGDGRARSPAPTGGATSRSSRRGRSYLDELQDAGVPVHAVGKIRDLFAGVGIDRQAHGGDQRGGDRGDDRAAARRSTPGSSSRTSSRPTRSTATATTSRASTARCARSTPRSADGSRAAPPRATCWSSPPTTASTRRAPHTDHTREYVPLLATFAGDGGRRHDGPLADVGASVLRWLTGRDAPALPGTSFIGA